MPFFPQLCSGSSARSGEFGKHARVENLPGVPSDSSFLGTFDREEALEDENIDFYASGHPLIEGILAHLADSPRGRVTLLHISGDEDENGFGLLALYKNGPLFEAVAIDIEGNERPEWAERLSQRPLKSRRVNKKSTLHDRPFPFSLFPCTR